MNVKTVAEQILGPILWLKDQKGIVQCPGYRLHARKGRPDCAVYVDKIPTVFCFHDSCKSVIKDVNRELRKTIWMLEQNEGMPTRKAVLSEMTPEQKKGFNEWCELQRLEARSATLKPHVTKNFHWTAQDAWHDSPVVLKHTAVDDYQKFLDLFDDDDTIWIGELTHSGEEKYKDRFRKVSQWRNKVLYTPYHHTCPSTFKEGSFSRSTENVLKQKFFVCESDILTRDETLSYYRWMRNEVGLNLRMIVDTGGKSMHGWFDMPSAKRLKELKAALVPSGFDSAMFKPAQPCRCPGIMRDSGGIFQKIVWYGKNIL